MSWTVTGLSAGEIAALKNVTITYKNQEPDECVFDLAMNYDGTLTTGAVQVTVKWLTTVIFRGYIQRVRRRGNGKEESCALVALGPWSEWDRTQLSRSDSAMEFTDNWETNKVYPWYLFNGTSTAAVILQDLAGKLPGFAVAGTMSVPSFVPPEKLMKNVTISMAIREVLKYFPNAITFFDYSTNPPAFRVVDKSSAVLNYAVPAAAIKDYEVEDKNDSILAGVVINYDLAVEVNDWTQGRKENTNSARLTDSTPGAALATTNHLWYQEDIGSVVYTKAYVYGANWRLGVLMTTYGTTLTIPKSGWIEFWQAQGVNVGSSSVANTAGVITLKSYLTANDGAGIANSEWVWLRQPLIEGLKWATNTLRGFVVAEFNITQTVDGVVRQAVFPAYRRSGAAANTGDYGWYTATPSVLPLPPGVGVAARLLADRSSVQSSGRIALSFDEVDLACLKKNRWTLPSGRLLEPIQQLTLELFSGRVTAEFGQATSLGIQDYIGLLKVGKPL